MYSPLKQTKLNFLQITVLQSSYLKACKLNSNFGNCSTKNGNLAIPFLVKGDPKWKIPVLDPLAITSLTVTENNARNVALNITLRDLMIHGLKNAKLVSSRIDLDKKHVEWVINVPSLNCLTKYQMSGKFLILPIIGAGPAIVNLENVKFTMTFDYKMYKKNNDDFMQITKSDLKYTTSRLHVKLENLFNGDKNLGDSTNKLINENWREFNNHVGPSVAQGIGTVLSKVIANIVKEVPFNNFFAK